MEVQAQKMLIIAIGNALRGDDAVAGMVCEALEKEYSHRVNFLYVQQLDIGLAESLSAYVAVLFVDASISAAKANINLLQKNSTGSGSRSFTHHIQPQVLAQLVQKLYGDHTTFFLCEIPVQALELSNELSAPARKDAAEATKQIEAWILSQLASLS